MTSRCKNPRDCNSDAVDALEPLKFGPCHKCRRRAVIMISSQNVGEKLTTMKGGDTTEDMRDAQPDLPSKLREVAIAGTSKETTQWTIVGVSQTAADVRAKQLQDPNIEAVLHAKEANSKPGKEVTETLSPAYRHYLLLWENLKLVDSVLIKEFTNKINQQSKDRLWFWRT